MKKVIFTFATILLFLLLANEKLIASNQSIKQISNTNSSPGFISNENQWDRKIKYLYHTHGLNFLVTDEAFYIDRFVSAGGSCRNNFGAFDTDFGNTKIERKGSVVKFELIDSKGSSHFIESKPSDCYYNYFIGNAPHNWLSKTRSYAQVSNEQIYSGIDMVLSIEDNMPRFDFVIQPHAEISQIKMKFTGQSSINLTKNQGTIELKTVFGSIYTGKIVAFQEIDGMKKIIPCKFRKQNDFVTFITGSYDKNYPLVIDPKIYSSYFGGSGDEEITGSVLDNSNNLIVTGWTNSTDFRTTPGSYDTLYNGGKDIFISKFSLNGTNPRLLFTTFLGGNHDDIAYGVDVDMNNNIYIAGETISSDYPFISGVNPQNGGKRDIVVSKLDSNGTKLIYSTYLGGENDDYALAIAVGESGAAYLTGGTSSNSFPMTTTYNIDGNKGREEVFVLKLSSSGSTVLYSALMTTAGLEHGTAISVDESQQSVIVVGITDNSRFYTNPNSGSNRVWDRYYNGGIDGFIAKFGSSGAFCQFAGFYGGPNDDYINAVYLDSDGSIYIAGQTNSTLSAINPASEATQFPVSNNAFSTDYIGGTNDAFFAKFNNTCNSMLMSTYFGGSGDDGFTSICKNRARNSFFLTGYTSSTDFPSISDDDNARLSGSKDAVIVEVSTLGTDFLYSSVFGGNKDDIGKTIVADTSGDIYITGLTYSKNLPVTGNSYQKAFGGGSEDGFIYKYTFRTMSLTTPVKSSQYCSGSSLNVQWSSTGMLTTELFTVQYSTDDGSNWITIIKDVTGSQYDWLIPKNQPEGNNYLIRVVHSSGLNAVSNGKFSIISPPAITDFGANTKNLTFCEGDSVYFFVTAIGKNIGYQWRKNGNLITGATDSIFYLNNLTVKDSGSYDVDVSGQCKPDTISPKIKINITPTTKIISNFDDKAVKKGDKVVFNVVASGRGNKYEWQKDKFKLAGETDSVFKIQSANKTNEGLYRCIVTGDCGADTTRQAKLSVDTVNDVNENSFLQNNLKLEIKYENEKSFKISIFSHSFINVHLYLTDNNGIPVKNIYEGILTDEIKEIYLDCNGFSSGVYWLVAESSKNATVRKLLIIK